MRGLENLIKLKVNLKNWSWGVAPAFKLDENDARGLLEDIAIIEECIGKLCEEYCYFVQEVSDKKTLKDLCGKCPVNKILGVKNDND